MAEVNGRKVFGIIIRNVKDLSENVQEMVFQKVNGRDDFSGYAKITYEEHSPVTIVDVEPIMGNPLKEFI